LAAHIDLVVRAAGYERKGNEDHHRTHLVRVRAGVSVRGLGLGLGLGLEGQC